MDDSSRARELVGKLNSLVEGDEIAARLIGCGPAAIAPVRAFLVRGKPDVVYQPRVRAVEVLGGLGARHVLIEYLGLRKTIADPAVRLAEEAVENAAARELARWRTPDVLEVLMRFALPQARSGIVEALGQFRHPAAIPYFVRALEDDICRAGAEEALRAFGRSAEIELVAAARKALPSPQEESPSSLRRRIAAIGLLIELRPSAECWPLLRPLLDESGAAIATGAARLAAMVGPAEDRPRAVGRLLSVLPAADWYLRTEIEDCLSSLYDDAQARIEQEIAARSASPKARQLADPVLSALLTVRRRNREG
jgi:HEAT repeat protein